MSVRIHPTALIENGVEIGDGTAIRNNAHICAPSRIGRQCLVGEKAYIARGVDIGDRVRINAFVHVCSAVTIEAGVMIAAGAVFTNDRFPRVTGSGLPVSHQSASTRNTLPTRVREGATIGARCVVGGDVDIGRFAMVGMTSVVTRSIPDFHLVTGQPARSTGVVCRCGQPLARFLGPPEAEEPRDLVCRACGLAYGLRHGRITEWCPPHALSA